MNPFSVFYLKSAVRLRAVRPAKRQSSGEAVVHYSATPSAQRYISLLEVMATVNRFTNFLDAFEPWRIKYTRAKPPDRTFFAGIIGYGCFIGTHKIASISSGIAEFELESTINGYFTLDNIY